MGLVFHLGHRLFWGREKDLPPRRRHLLLGMVYLSLAGNMAWLWTMADAGNFGSHYKKIEDLVLEMWHVATCLRAYHIDHGVYPAAVDREGRIVPFSDNGSGVSAGYLPWRLTTPLAYVGRLPLDPYSARKNGGRVHYRYATDGKTGYIIATNGPDKDADIPLADYSSPGKGGRGPDQFLAREGYPNAAIYDPSNGVLTSGDIVKTDEF